jgi:hypothetical protein
MEINRFEIGDILGNLPKIESFNIDRQVDLLITTLGFEDRTHSIIDKLVNTGKMHKKPILLIEYPTNKEDNIKNYSFFEKAAKAMESPLIRLTYSRKDFTQKLGYQLDEILAKKSYIVFDISSCSSYVFYPIMKALYNLDIDLSIVYSEAEKYYPTFEEWDEVNKTAESEKSLFVESFENAKFQSAGVDDIYAYNIFSEINPGNKPCILIAVPNFSCQRVNAIIARDNELNKTKYEDILWIIGKPPADNNEWRIKAVMKTNNLYNKPPTKIKSACTLDYKEMIKALEDVWSDVRYKYHLTLGTLGSKNQHLGTFFFLALHQDVGLWLAEPKEFRANRFSEGEGESWQINFGSISKLKESLSSYLTFRWQL